MLGLEGKEYIIKNEEERSEGAKCNPGTITVTLAVVKPDTYKTYIVTILPILIKKWVSRVGFR